MMGKRIAALFGAVLLLSALCAPGFANQDGQRVWRVVVSDTVAYEDRANAAKTASIEYEISGNFAVDPGIKLVMDKIKPEAGLAGVHIWKRYKGSIRIGDTIRVKAIFHKPAGLYGFWLGGETRSRTETDNFFKVREGGDAYHPCDHTFEKEYTVVDDGTARVLAGFSNSWNANVDIHFELDVVGGKTRISTTHAETNPGEDEGVPIGETVVVSVGGALVGAGLAGLSRNKRKKKKKKNEEEEKKAAPTYKMYVYKGFGDAIQRGAPPVKVYARIAQVVEGKEYGCPELTAKIQASGTHLTVKPLGIENGRLCAEVSAAVDEAAQEAEVIFTLAGAGGAFVRKIIFRLTGNPEIKFPALSEDGKNWLMDAGLDTVDMIAGGRGRDRLRFVFQDAATEPIGIRFLDTDGFDISYEKDAGKPFTYYACIQNKTEPIPKESKIFADPVARTITIEATFSGKLKVYGRFTINLYPMGIAVFPVESRKLSGKEIVQNGRLDVVSYRVNDSWNTGLEKEIRASAFYLHFGAERADGTAVPVEEVRFSFAKKLKAEETRSEGVASHYSYTVGSGNEDKSHVFFLPETVSPELVGTHEMLLEVRASGGGKQETEMIPLRILGLDPGPPVEWYREHQLLLEAITRYYPADMAPTKRREVEENFYSPEVCDVAELRTLRRTVILWSQTYWRHQENLAQQEKDLYWARVWTLTVWGTKKLKWAGDVAFTVLLCSLGGVNGPIYEAWLSPVKDFAADAIGNLIADINYGGGKYNYLKNFEIKFYEALEKRLMAEIKTENLTKAYSADTRKLFLQTGFIMTCFLVLDAFKNYREMEPEERDYWKAVTRAFSNLSQEALKKLFGFYLDKLMNSPKMDQFFRSKFMQMINSKVKGVTRTNYTYNGRPLVVQYQGKLISIQGTATGNVDVARGAARGLNLHLADGRTVHIPNVRADQGNAYLGYIEVISETLGKTFEDAVKLVLDAGVKNAEKAAQDGTALIYLGIDLSFLDPDLPPLTVEIDKKKFCNNPLSEGFGLLFKMIFGCLKLGDLFVKLLPSPMEALQNAYDTTEKVWQYLAGKTDGEQIDWSIFDDD